MGNQYYYFAAVRSRNALKGKMSVRIAWTTTTASAGIRLMFCQIIKISRLNPDNKSCATLAFLKKYINLT